MDFTLTADQATLATSLDKLASRYETKPTDFHGFALTSPALEQELDDGGFFEIAQIPELGPVAAAMAVERLARLPYAAEVALSMLVRPQLAGDWPRPFALVEHGRPGRFVAQAKTVLAIEGETITILQPAPDTLEPVDSLFAYPMGRLKTPKGGTALPDAASVRKWLRVALAAEAAGLMQAASRSAGRSAVSRRCAIGWRNAPCWPVASGCWRSRRPGPKMMAMQHWRLCTPRKVRRASSMISIRCWAPWA
jgi:hypothetical protein